MVLDFLLKAKVMKDITANIEDLQRKGPVSPKRCGTDDCKQMATSVNDLVEYSTKNLPKKGLTNQYLMSARVSCANCPRTPEDSNCEDVIRRVGLAGYYLTNS